MLSLFSSSSVNLRRKCWCCIKIMKIYRRLDPFHRTVINSSTCLAASKGVSMEFPQLKQDWWGDRGDALLSWRMRGSGTRLLVLKHSYVLEKNGGRGFINMALSLICHTKNDKSPPWSHTAHLMHTEHLWCGFGKIARKLQKKATKTRRVFSSFFHAT